MFLCKQIYVFFMCKSIRVCFGCLCAFHDNDVTEWHFFFGDNGTVPLESPLSPTAYAPPGPACFSANSCSDDNRDSISDSLPLVSSPCLVPRKRVPGSSRVENTGSFSLCGTTSSGTPELAAMNTEEAFFLGFFCFV